MVSQTVIDIVRKYLLELKKYGISVDKAFLFGSQIKSTANEDSDIDVLIVSSMFDKERSKYIGKVWLATEVSGYKIEPHAVGLQRFLEDNYTPIITVVKNEGIEIN